MQIDELNKEAIKILKDKNLDSIFKQIKEEVDSLNLSNNERFIIETLIQNQVSLKLAFTQL